MKLLVCNFARWVARRVDSAEISWGERRIRGLAALMLTIAMVVHSPWLNW